MQIFPEIGERKETDIYKEAISSKEGVPTKSERTRLKRHLKTEMSTQIYKSPNRFLFIASIGNPAPYTETRHSAGHVLLDAIQPQLYERIGLSVAGNRKNALSSARSIFYSTWKSPSLMNVSGPPLLRQLKSWLTDREKYLHTMNPDQPFSVVSQSLNGDEADEDDNSNAATIQLLKASSEPITIDIRALKERFRPTLVILHDELEARPGQIKVRQGGPQQASLRGHRGLISIMESLRGAGLLSAPSKAQSSQNISNFKNLAILRIGIGIGRPSSRERNAVSDYVLSKIGTQELQALMDAVPGVVDTLVQEMYRKDDDEV